MCFGSQLRRVIEKDSQLLWCPFSTEVYQESSYTARSLWINPSLHTISTFFLISLLTLNLNKDIVTLTQGGSMFPPRDADTKDDHDDFDSFSLNPNLTEIDAVELLQGKSEVFLVLDGVRYRLRRTRRNKLILQK